MLLTILLSLSLLFAQASRSYNDISVSSLTPTQGITLNSLTSPNILGFNLNKAGDFNSDGFDDIVIGSPGANGGFGVVYIIFGSKNGLVDLTVTAGMTASQGMAIYGANAGDRLGDSVNHAGDVNGDGIDDIIISSHLYQYSKGIAYVIYGSKTPPAQIDLSQGLSLIRGFTVTGANMFDSLGRSGGRAGDINNDKIDDIIIGADGVSGSKGTVYVIFGKKGTRGNIDLSLGLSSPVGFTITGAASNHYLGLALSDAGDVDGDGLEDFIVGAYGAFGLTGAAYVIYGRNSAFSTIDLSQGLSPSQGFTITGSSTGAQFGKSFGRAGDFNGDGRPDVIIGAPGENTAYVIFGKERGGLTDLSLSSGVDPKRGIRIKGVGTGSGFGGSVSGAGDINGDGIGDVIVGALLANGNTGVGYVIFGSKAYGAGVDLNNGLGSQEGFSVIGASANDYLGAAVSTAGDVNGDGMSDLIVGAYGVMNNAGAAYLLFTPVVCPENCLSCEKFGVCLVCNAGYRLENSKCLLQCPPSTKLENGKCVSPPLKTATEVSKGLFDSGSTASRIFTLGRSLSVGLGLIAKIIQNLRFLDIEYPEETLSAFKTYGTDLFELPIPEIFYEPPETKRLPLQYSRYDMSPTFLENYWQTMMTMLISLSMFLLIKVLQFLTKGQDKKSLLQVALKNIGQTLANFFIVQIYANLDDVIFFLLLDIQSTELSSPSAGVSMGIAIFFLLLGLALVFFHCWLLSKYQQAKSQGNLERFERTYRILGTLYEDFKDDSIAKQSFFGILILRCIILILVIMLLQPQWMQASILMLTNLIFLAYFIYHRPFKSLFDEVSQYFCELAVFAAYLCVLILSILDAQNVERSDLRKGLGKCIVIAGIVLCLGGFIVQMIQLVGAIKGICRFLKNYYSKKELQVSTLDQTQNNLKAGSIASESSSILRHASQVCLSEQLDLSSLSRKNKRILPSEKLQGTTKNELETSSRENNNDTTILNQPSRRAVPRIVRPRREEPQRAIEAPKIQAFSGPLGSLVHREIGLLNGQFNNNNNQGESSFMVQNDASVRKRKIRRVPRPSNLSSFNNGQ